MPDSTATCTPRSRREQIWSPAQTAASHCRRDLATAARRPRRRHRSETHFGCTFGFPPGVPGGGMTLSRPPLGGATCISGSTPAGGQMTLFDWASLSLNGAKLPPPTVGGSPFVSGGHVAPFSRDGFALGCASAKFTAATVANAAMRTTPACKANNLTNCRTCTSTCGTSERSPSAG